VDGPILSREELERARLRHVRELKRIEQLTDEQFEVFRKNFSVGVYDARINRAQALEVLKSMILTNLSLQQRLPR